MRVAVTGSSGFIGAAVVAALAGRGHDVIAVSRQPRAVPDGVTAAVVADYRDTPPSDVLIHLAESRDAGAVDDADASANEALCARLLETCGRMVYASSAVIYGDGVSAPRRPGEAVAPPSAYGRGKRACEKRVTAAGGLSLRLANVYGPGMAPNNVLSDILGQIAGDAPLRLRDLGAVRDFLWLADAAAGFVLAAEAVAAAPARRPVYNLGSGRGLSVAELARLALEAAGQPDRPLHATAPAGRPSVLVLDITTTVADLRWQPAAPPEERVRCLVAERLRDRKGTS